MQSQRMDKGSMLIVGVLVLTSFVMMLNETALAVALPNIMAEFGVGAATAQWLLTAVMLTMAIMMPLAGWILDRFTTRQVYFFAALFFLAGSVVAALSPSFAVMLVGRVLQAVGTAVVIPLQMTVVMTVVPPARRGTVMGLISIVMAVGPALGPTFAGAVMSVFTWHMTFWIMSALVLLAALFGVGALRNVGVTKRVPLDVVSAVLSVFAFGGLVYGLSSVGEVLTRGPGMPVAVVAAIVGVVGLALFVWRQVVRGRRGGALLDLSPLRIRNFVVGVVVILLFQGVMLGASNTLPLFMQGALLVSVLVAGLVNLPGGLVETVFSPFAGALYDRVGPRPLVVPGAAIGAGAMLWMGTVSFESPVWLVVVMFAVFSFGLALVLTPLMTASLSSLPGELYSHGSAILNTLMQLAGAAGTAVMITTFELVAVRGGDTPQARGEGGALVFLLCGVLLVVATVVSLFLQPPPSTGKVVIKDQA